MKRIILLLVLLSLLLSACVGTAQETKSNRTREKNPTVDETAFQTLVDGNNAFALELYQSLRSENGNLILSPFSISLALAMTYAGARGETEIQMVDVLNFGPQEQTHRTFNALDLALEDRGMALDKDQEPLQLNIANSVWAEQTFAFLPNFLDTLALNYGAGIHQLDFINAPDPSRKTINKWVSDQTEDKINDLLPENSVTTDTKMVLVNAIYFKADWLDQFDAEDTYDREFTLLDGSQVNTPMMGQAMQIPYVVRDGYTVAEFPYAGGTAAMTIILPDAGRFEEVESQLSSGMLQDALGSMVTSPVIVRIPKFEYESSFSLPDTLSAMGMPLAFDENRADFSGMTQEQDLYIGNVIHKAFVAVDEEGTEAAAATAVIMEGTGAVMIENEFIADRPFIYLIRDIESGQILFIGRVLNPQ